MAKVLIVDDDLETIKLLETVVQMDGHETEHVLRASLAARTGDSDDAGRGPSPMFAREFEQRAFGVRHADDEAGGRQS